MAIFQLPVKDWKRKLNSLAPEGGKETSIFGSQENVQISKLNLNNVRIFLLKNFNCC